MTRTTSALVRLIGVALVVLVPVTAQAQITPDDARAIAKDAYIYPTFRTSRFPFLRISRPTPAGSLRGVGGGVPSGRGSTSFSLTAGLAVR
ncbi:MAG: hypothetical protein EHM42_03530 [Planctomycetaceae bacterium]|nr:MAG: hypothetical protein EHM42_03530 [Planctomycetaceae bacterium]